MPITLSSADYWRLFEETASRLSEKPETESIGSYPAYLGQGGVPGV
jgi:hypothetical protein